jgi:hypothetical protein
MTTDPDGPSLYDVLIVPRLPTQRVSEQGVRAWVNYFHAMGLIHIVEETQSEDWVELYFKPTYASHALFHDGESRGGPPVFEELCLRFGNKASDPGYPDVEDVFFLLEFRGTPFERVLEEVTARTHDILYIHPRVHTRPHLDLPIRPEQEGEAVDKRLKRKERGSALVGTRTEDF